MNAACDVAGPCWRSAPTWSAARSCTKRVTSRPQSSYLQRQKFGAGWRDSLWKTKFSCCATLVLGISGPSVACLPDDAFLLVLGKPWSAAEHDIFLLRASWPRSRKSGQATAFAAAENRGLLSWYIGNEGKICIQEDQQVQQPHVPIYLRMSRRKCRIRERENLAFRVSCRRLAAFRVSPFRVRRVSRLSFV